MTFETSNYWEANQHAQDYQKHLGAQHPPCAGCGMPLVPDPGKDDLICNFCGLGHHFLPPPSPSEHPEFHVGDNVAAEWKGNWWFAHVVDEMAQEHKWRIHFIGWGEAFDTEMDATRIRPIDYFPGDTIIQPHTEEAQKNSLADERVKFPAAAGFLLMMTILGFAFLFLFPQTTRIPNAPVQPDVPGVVIGEVSNVPVTASTTVIVGQKFHVLRGNTWYMGSASYVNTVTGDITVRYSKWGREYEEVVPRTDLRLVK